MKIKGFMVGSILTILILTTISSAQEPPADSAFFTLFGQVFDVGGAPALNGAQVTLTAGGRSAITTTATNIRGENGYYQFELANFPASPNQGFAADLAGANEVPPVSTVGTGQAVFTLSPDGNVLHFKVAVSNVANATLSHIHMAPAGVNGPIVVDLFLGPTKVGRFSGVLAEGDITSANLKGPLLGLPLSHLIENMSAGGTYVNVHTTQNPGGEIRGQVRSAAILTISAKTVGASPGAVGNSATIIVPQAIAEPQRADIVLASGGGILNTGGGVGGGTPAGGGGGGPSGGGGGGGGGASGENFTNVIVREKYDEAIFKDRVTSYKFKNASNPITHVNVTGNINAGLITAMIEVLRGTSTLVSEAPPGVVNQNVNVWLGTSGFAVPKNIKEVIIRFRVENSWMQSNNVDPKDIKLLRWDSTSKRWDTLKTEVKEKVDTVTYFEAETNRLSPLAISAAVSAPGGPVAGGPGATPGIPGKTSTKPKSTPGFEIAAAIAALSALHMLWRKRKTRKNRT